MEENVQNNQNLDKNENKKNMELIYNWYQSYYLWSIANSQMALMQSQLNFLMRKIKL
jgi:hypothetical protein